MGLIGWAVSSVLMVSTVCAQTTAMTSPARFADLEGESWSTEFGHLPDYRHMLFDGEVGGRALVLSGVRLREDYRDQFASGGRRWTKVSLDLSTCDFHRLSRVFSQNPTSTPKRVFSSAVAWPTVQGLPATRPAPWGGRRGALTFPFSSKYVHVGKDLCLDFRFQGGVLASRGSWSGGQGRYQLDSFGHGWRNASWSTMHGKGCRDSSWSLGGVLVVDSATHGATDPNPSFRLKHVFQTNSFGTARGKPVMHAIGPAGTTVGTVFPGVTCEKLFLDLTQPTAILSYVADLRTSMAQSPFLAAAYAPQSVGAQVWAQAAWADSQNGMLRLSKAMRTSVVDLPRNYRRKALVQRPSGTVGPSVLPVFNPILNWH